MKGVAFQTSDDVYGGNRFQHPSLHVITSYTGGGGVEEGAELILGGGGGRDGLWQLASSTSQGLQYLTFLNLSNLPNNDIHPPDDNLEGIQRVGI